MSGAALDSSKRERPRKVERPAGTGTKSVSDRSAACLALPISPVACVSLLQHCDCTRDCRQVMLRYTGAVESGRKGATAGGTPSRPARTALGTDTLFQ
mgnify:CR=1 FL=1